MRRATTIIGLTLAWMMLASTAHAADTSDLWRFADGSSVDGASSSLGRGSNGLRVKMSTSGLDHGHSVTVWWVIFNDPGACQNPTPFGSACGEPDLFEADGTPKPGVSALYAAGHVIGGSGKATFAGSLKVGDTEGALFGPGVTDPLGAEVHLVVRDHGPKSDPAFEIHNFGGCNPECVDLQFAIHVA